ncbi:ATP-binding protein [Sedimentibacter sp. MB31-C6]|uniref:ATP-binding protein n=1 Tax=Sedimentibacter sp. MB31-C6 TaxID=3109366 RepID=UPI002DDD496A|nr:ATP-binding protein [Sedimentibacter sp. MB36-C1]WSI02893.1 ATP-binding protein [Sedimentibacter sp. MB36-C1]
MFKSIKWRFILIYFLLVFLAMSIVGMFIVAQLEQTQIEMNSKNMEDRIKLIVSADSLQNDVWNGHIEEIQNSINNIQVGYNENVYVILNDDKKTIIAGSVENTIGESAFNSNNINNYILTKSMDGDIAEIAPPDIYEETDYSDFYHMSYPVNTNGNIKGYIYLTNNIDYIYKTVDQSKSIMTQATVIALSLTVFLGLVLATSITGPIKELTVKAKLMSQGNFDQKVEVKSNDEIGQLGNMFNFLIDELKTTMLNLHQEKSKMETTFKYMADGVLTVDKNGNIIHANPVARQIVSLEINDENYDKAVSEFMTNMSLNDLRSHDWHGTEIIQRNGETYKIDYAPFMDNKEEIGGVILVFKNITEQYKMENMQKEFVANVSHELKTPITTIKSYAETLLDGALNEPPIAEEFLNVINSESDRMSRLVSDLLRLSRMDYAQTNWTKEKLNVKELLKDIYRKLHIQAKNKSVTMHMGEVPNDLSIDFDRDGFEQIMLNIAGNAVKYTPENGNVWVNVIREKGKIIISIKDDGIGIPKEDQNRIFERFYRVDKARARQLGGTGLGLSIAKQIAEAHDSILTVESEVQRGTEIKIIIPELV